jgi:RNA polymerase sigma factor (sigma-70 family)
MTHRQAAPLLRHIHRLATADGTPPPADGDCLARFADSGDGAAFAVLVRRHGPMVFRVCRVVLSDAHAAEDAFQATFLALARRAAAVRRCQSLGSWLYKVAFRVALRARGARAELLRREAGAPRPPAADPLAEVSWREVEGIVFEELGKLSEHYRAPLLLCCLEGMNRDEAAAQLGCAAGTLKMRLERGRKLLRGRLARRGLTLSAGLLAAELSEAAGAVAVPAVVAAATVGAAVALRNGSATAPFASERALALSHEAVGTMAAGRIAAATLLAVSALAATGLALVVHRHGTAAPVMAGQPGDAAADRGAPRLPAGGPGERLDLHGDPLPPEAVCRLGTVRLRHGGLVDFVRFTPDGKTLVTHGSDGVRTWDVATGKQILALPPEATGRHGATLSADGGLLATAGEAGVRLWALPSATPLRTLGGGTYIAPSLSADGRFLAALSTGRGSRVDLFETQTGRTVWSRALGKPPFNHVEFAPGGRQLVLSGCAMLQRPPRSDNAILFVDALTGKDQGRIALGTRTPNHVALSADGRLVAVSCHGFGEPDHQGRGFVWDVASGKQLLQLDPPEDKGGGRRYLTALLFAPDGKSLITSGSSDSLVEWDLATGKERRRVGHYLLNSMDIVLSPDGALLAAVGGPAVRVLDRRTGEDRTPAIGFNRPVAGVALSADRRTALIAEGSGRIALWDARTGRLRSHFNVPQSFGFRPALDEHRLVSINRLGPGEKAVFVWDTATGKLRSRLPFDFEGKKFPDTSLSPDGTRLAVVGHSDGAIHLIDPANGKSVGRLHEPGLEVRQVEFAGDGRKLFAFCTNDTFQVWDVARGVKLRRLGPTGGATGDPPVCNGQFDNYRACVSPDGARIAYAKGGTLTFIDAGTGKEILRCDVATKAPPTLIPGPPSVLTFSPDGRTLAWATYRDPALRLLEVASGKERHVLDGHLGEPDSVAFSADGTTLVSGGTDTTALVWDLTGRQSGAVASKPPSPAELDACWAALAGEDAPSAYAAIRTLAAWSAEALPYLERRLRPVERPGGQRLAALIADLNSDQFATREAAAGELEVLGDAALAACREGLAGRPSAEARRRLEALVARRAEQLRHPTGEELRSVRALEALEFTGTPQARRILETLARGMSEAQRTVDANASLDRLTRRGVSAP